MSDQQPVSNAGGPEPTRDPLRAENARLRPQNALDGVTRSLRENRRFVLRVAETSPDLIAMADLAARRVEYANGSFCRFLGRTLDELRRMDLGFLLGTVHPEDLPTLRRAQHDLATADESDVVEFEARFRHATGDWRWLFCRESVFGRDARGAPRRVLASASDVTDRRRAEHALRESNALLERMFSNIHLQVAYLDTSFNFVRVNAAYAAGDGRPAEFYRGKNHFALFPNAENQAIFQRVLDTGEPFAAYGKPFEYVAHPERGVTYWDWSLQPVRDAAGRVSGLVLSLLNVTERKHAQMALAESERLFRGVFEQSFMHISLVSSDGALLEVNRTGLAISGVTHADVIGRPVWQAPWWRHTPESIRLLRQAIASASEGRAVRRQMEMAGRDGPHAADVSVKPVMDERGHIEMVIIEARDITEQRRLEKEIVEIGDRERARIGDDLHDVLGQELTGIAFLCKALERNMQKRSAPEVGDISHISDLISHAITQTRGLSKGLCPVAATPDGTMNALRHFCQQTEAVFNVRCEFRCNDRVYIENPLVATHFFRIAQEAVNNAIKHGHAGRVIVRLTESVRGRCLTIKDDGAGLPPENARGSGMGLRIMRHRGNLIGALVDVRPIPGGGTIVLCWAPRGPAPNREESNGEAQRG